MTGKLILKSFAATRIFPIDREAVLKRFCPTTPRTLEEDDKQEPQSSPFIKMRRVIKQVIKDGEQRKAQKIADFVHHVQVTNELLREENNGLQKALKLKQMHKKKGKVLNLQQRAEYHSSAVFWSPRKLKEAEYREAVRLQEEKEESLRASLATATTTLPHYPIVHLATSTMHITIKTPQRLFTTDPENWLGESEYFRKLFSGKWSDKQEDGSYFIGSDAYVFEHIL
ncbi:uncharacterized protein CC84DRAFT_1106131 [Paraphaeosphaeria sporulosa]|uniref:Uncharacterized protein n=1 Tax=Paraphaeosphaeria sporulosa TaxID=1460663 RepID=A0A177BT24_9PLEO|nr:uncharacterized protein CC84DRAFT_1106131 [Paraphaeosphaeria sporulosa]OAF98533.1 hypothetical protein CC84DRAFT_1106131 [Paraphaeosphaeria sporulosa]